MCVTAHAVSQSWLKTNQSRLRNPLSSKKGLSLNVGTRIAVFTWWLATENCVMSIHVLIAEPDVRLLEVYCKFMTKEGFEVTTTTNGSDCVESLRRCRPDVLLLEPDLDNGWREKLLPLMRDDPDLSCVPVIVLTRNDHGAHEFPVREYFVKPFSMSRLAKIIETTVSTPSTRHSA